ncbi:hypothetical protein NC239_19415 [Streptomyces sp. G3]|nr:hypothetical protein [Streptomyces sp. G3]
MGVPYRSESHRTGRRRGHRLRRVRRWRGGRAGPGRRRRPLAAAPHRGRGLRRTDRSHRHRHRPPSHRYRRRPHPRMLGRVATPQRRVEGRGAGWELVFNCREPAEEPNWAVTSRKASSLRLKGPLVFFLDHDRGFEPADRFLR